MAAAAFLAGRRIVHLHRRPRIEQLPRRRRIEQPRILPPHPVAAVIGRIGEAIAQIAGHRIANRFSGGDPNWRKTAHAATTE